MKKKKEEPPKIVTFETFKKFGSYDMQQMEQKEPFCFNGFVGVHKYKVTIEVIEEPTEVYAERLQKLWYESDNHHDYIPLLTKAKQLGVTIAGVRGSERKNEY